MLLDESLANIRRTAEHLANNDPDYASHPAVVAAPDWFLDMVKQAASAQMLEPTDQVDQIHGCKVVRQDIPEPKTVAADGTVYPVLPDWARRANRGEPN